MRNAEKGGAILSPPPFQSPGEEVANSAIHGFGTALAAAGMVLLILKAGSPAGEIPEGGPALRIAVSAIYASSLIAMFLASTLYHAFRHGRAKRVFRILDHGAIYLLIAGTYTAYGLIALRGALGWAYTGFEWALAAAGISLYAAGVKFIKRVELIVYLVMGWAIVAGFPRLLQNAPGAALVFLSAGGLAYTLGTIWYCRQRRLSHVIWHVFVLAGAAFHWFSIWLLL
jgi:hemolysin III